MEKERLIEIKLPKYTLFLKNTEMLQLLSYNRAIWKTGIQRGKGILRARKMESR